MARNHIPSDIRELEGNPSKREIPEEIEIEVGSFKPPEILDKIGRKYWKKYSRLLHQMGKYTQFNEIVLENLCMAVSARNRAFEAIAKVNKSMLQVVDRFDGGQEIKESEPAKILRHWTQIVERIASDCGMTPGKSAGVYKPRRDEDPMDGMLD